MGLLAGIICILQYTMLIAKKVFKFSFTIIIDNNTKLVLEHDLYIGSSK